MTKAWILFFYLDGGWSFSQSPEGGIKYESKADCIEQMQMIKEQAKDNDYKVLRLYCRPELDEDRK